MIGHKIKKSNCILIRMTEIQVKRVKGFDHAPKMKYVVKSATGC
jgi:hypothetical protein